MSKFKVIMKGFRQLALSLLLLGPSLLAGSSPAFADPFVDKPRFNDHHHDFMRSLGDVGDQMRRDHDYTNVQQSQRHHADQRSIQDGTQAVSQQAFEASQMQAVKSGGLYNGNSSYGTNGIGGPFGFAGFGLGGFGIGNQAAPTPNTNADGGSDSAKSAANSSNETNSHGSLGTQPSALRTPQASQVAPTYYSTTNGMNGMHRVRQGKPDPLSGSSFLLPSIAQPSTIK